MSPEGTRRANPASAVLILLATCALAAHAQSFQKPELILQAGHYAAVNVMQFSPDGQLLLTSSSDETLKLWDVAAGRELRVFDRQSGRAAAFSPDSKMVASAYKDGTIRLWDVASGKEMRRLTGKRGEMTSLALSPDGLRIVAAYFGEMFATLWDAQTGREIARLEGSSRTARVVAFSRDGRMIARGSDDNSVKLWDAATGRSLRVIGEHVRDVNSVVFSPDGTLLATTGNIYDEEIMVWEVATGRRIMTLIAPPGRGVTSITFSPDGKRLLSTEEPETVAVWNAETGVLIKRFVAHANPSWTVAFSPDGKLFASADFQGEIKFWAAATYELVKTLSGHSEHVRSIKVSPDGKLVAAASYDNTIKLWDVAAGRELMALSGHRSGVQDVAFSPDGKTIASVSIDQTVRLWEAASGKELRRLVGHTNTLQCVAFSPDGRTVASAGDDDSVRLWDVSSGVLVMTLSLSGTVHGLAFSPDGRWLASASEGEGKLRLWNLKTGRVEQTYIGSGQIGYPWTIAFSPDGRQLISGVYDNSIRLWDVATGEELRIFEGHNGHVYSAIYSADGTMILSGSTDETVRLWDVGTGREVRRFTGHTAYVSSVAFSGDGKRILTASSDTSVKVWDAGSGRELASMIAIDARGWLVVTPDGLFDGSTDAWQQLFWRFGGQTFDYAPVEAFFSEFYRPGLLKEVFEGNTPDVPRSLASLDRRQPKVTISLAAVLGNGGTNPRVRRIKVEVEEASAGTVGPGEIRQPAGEVRDMRLFRNGALVKFWRGKTIEEIIARNADCALTLGQASRGRKVTCTAASTVVAGHNTFTSYAFNRDDVKSNDHSLIVEGDESLKRAGTLYVLAVGIDEYADETRNLRFAVDDVEGVSAELAKRQKAVSLYADTKVVMLTNGDATKENIRLALERFAGRELPLVVGRRLGLRAELERISPAQPEDALLIYFAGHGTARCVPDQRGGRTNCDRFYLIPHEGFPDGAEGWSRRLYAASLSDEEMEALLEPIDAGRLLMVIDACNSGQVLEAEEKRRGPMNSRGLAQLAYEKGISILTASQSLQSASETVRLGNREVRHGLLTYALLEALDDERADRDGDKELSEREWMDYAVENVPAYQLAAMKWRRAENQGQPASSQRAEIVYVVGDDPATPPEKRELQSPRAFYRRPTTTRPFIVARR